MTHPTLPRHTDAELDEIAARIAFGVLLAAIAELGLTPRAIAAACAAVALTDAIETGDNPS